MSLTVKLLWKTPHIPAHGTCPSPNDTMCGGVTDFRRVYHGRRGTDSPYVRPRGDGWPEEPGPEGTAPSGPAWGLWGRFTACRPCCAVPSVWPRACLTSLLLCVCRPFLQMLLRQFTWTDGSRRWDSERIGCYHCGSQERVSARHLCLRCRCVPLLSFVSVSMSCCVCVLCILYSPFLSFSLPFLVPMWEGGNAPGCVVASHVVPGPAPHCTHCSVRPCR